MTDEIYNIYKEYALFYKLDNKDIKKLWNIIKPICEHEEFQKRMKKPFYHHDLKTLGEHILCDTIVTYKLVLKYNKKIPDKININNACLIAMFHDLYEQPWQNLGGKKLADKHGFTHPIEAAINAITWFPEYFTDKNKAFVIIDGIVHHMYPLPVRSINKGDFNINNKKKYDLLSENYKSMIALSTKIGKVGKISFRKSLFLEGRMLSRADKKVAIGQELKSTRGLLSMVTGKNKKIDKDFNVIKRIKINKKNSSKN